ncbi:M81 family metallopeptidase [Roseibium algae]|uniref:Microcystinase C n=1 Tax=Roseibium algae TaxID=3123038 RepID=A0ABU8TNF8_9HYPH
MSVLVSKERRVGVKKRVAIAGFLHETNTFAPSLATYDHFVEGGGHMPLSCGDELLERCQGVNIGISGAVVFGNHANWDLVPLLWAAAIPSAHVDEIAFEKILRDLILRLEAAGDLDGVYLDLHGAMVCQHIDDGEGEIIARVRAVVGPDVSVAVTLDLHGNVTQKMVTESDVMVAYRTYPHVDMAESGRRTAVQLNALMMRGAPFAKTFRQLPFLIPIPWQCTDIEPAKSLYSSLAQAEGGMVSSLSFLTGFPAADFADCGPCVLGYGEDAVAVQTAVDDFCAQVLDRETDFGGKAYSPDEGIALAISLSARATKPIVIADTQDNPGAGGDSNTAGLLKALVEADAQRTALGLMVDPDAARLVHEAGEGAEIPLTLGGKSGVVGDIPFSGTFRIEKLSDGKFTTTGPYYGGAQMDLGPSACLVLGGVRVVLASKKVQMADQAMYRFVGIEPMDQAILVNKSSVHFRADFAPIAADILVCTAPGPMALYASDLPFKKLSEGIRLSPGGPAFNSDQQEAVAKAS